MFLCVLILTIAKSYNTVPSVRRKKGDFMNKNFHNFLMGVSVLPALLVMPALAVTITENTDLNETFPNGVIEELVRSQSGYTGTLTTSNISVTDSVDSGEKNYLVLVANPGSVLNFGTESNPADSINIEYVGPGTRAFTVWDGGVANLYGSNINISARDQGFVTWGDYNAGKQGSATIVGDNITISAANALYVNEGTTASLTGQNINISGDDGITAWGKSLDSEYVAGGTINVDTDDLNINVKGTGIGANYGNSQITVEATGDVNIVARGSDDTRAIHAGNSTLDPNVTKPNTSFVSITADNINLTADKIAISAMSNGWVDLIGNVNISAKDAILARGYATVNINESGENTVKMRGNVDFDYYSLNSGSLINAFVNVNLTDAQSYWTGNTVASYLYEDYPGDEKMGVESFNLSLSNGAVWNATKIKDTSRTFVKESDGKTYKEGEYYIALNNLNIDNGTVNIADTTRGITVENAIVADATFNGGPLNIGEMTLTGGTNTFSGDIIGVDDTSTLTIANGATMDIGANSINVNAVTLNGNMLATLRRGETAQIAATTFGGNGTIDLTLNGAGTYNIKTASFGGTINVLDSNLFVYDWDDEEHNSITVETKSVSDIAEQNGIQEETATVVAGLATSTSEKLNDLAEKIQEKLASGAAADKVAVEQATKAINPEKAAVVQSSTTSVQNTVTNLASSRMSMPRFGRNGGDLNFTSGGVWAQGLYNKSKMNGQFNGYTRGVAAGIDGTIDKIVTLGAGYAFNKSDVDLKSRNTDIDSNTIFAYGQYKPAEWYINAVANYTWSKYSEDGTVLGTPVNAEYDTNAFGGAVMTGYDFASGITPELGLRYLHVDGQTYTNSLGVKSKLHSADYLTAMLGTKYGFNIVTDRNTLFRPELRYAVKYDIFSDKSSATVAMPGVAAYTLNGGRLSRIGGEFGVGLTVKYQELDVSLSYDIDVREDYTSQTGMLKFRYNF